MAGKIHFYQGVPLSKYRSPSSVLAPKSGKGKDGVAVAAGSCLDSVISGGDLEKRELGRCTCTHMRRWSL